MDKRVIWALVALVVIGCVCCSAIGLGWAAYRLAAFLATPEPSPTLPSPQPPSTETLPPQPMPTATFPAQPQPTDVPAPEPLPLRLSIPTEGVTAIVPFSDGRLGLFTTTGQVGFLDPNTGEITEGPPLPEPDLEEVILSPDARYMALQFPKAIRVLDLVAGEHIFVLTPEEIVRHIAFSPQSTLLLVGGETTLNGYYVETGDLAFSLGLSAPADDFIMTPDERLLFQLTWGKDEVPIWDTFGGLEWNRLSFHAATAIALAPDGLTLAVAENRLEMLSEAYPPLPYPERLALWHLTIDSEAQQVQAQLRTTLPLQTFNPGEVPQTLTILRFTPDGRRLVGLASPPVEGGGEGRLDIWDVASGRWIGYARLPAFAWKMVLMADGRLAAVLFSGYGTNEVRLYEIP